MTAKQIHMRSTGSRQQYFIPKFRYEARRLQDATEILRLEYENRKLKNIIKEMLG